MRIQLKGRGGATADEELLSRVEKKLEKVAKQVSPLAECKIELREERGEQVADGAIKLKGVTLRARETGSDAAHALNLVADDLARQVKKHREKRRGRREAQRAAAQQHAV
jgi:putative sigma-54 modulation protein